MIAGPREERLNVLSELVKWAHVEADARDRGQHRVARDAGKRMREAVSLLGFDPLEYDVTRDAVASVITRRVRRLVNAMPGTTSEIARAAGVLKRDVPAYLSSLVEHGDVIQRRSNNTTYWEVAD